MATIGPCKYDNDGRLIQPGLADIARATDKSHLSTSTKLTTDSGQLHVHTVNASARTPAEAKARAGAKLKELFDHLEFVSGYRKVGVRKMQGVLPCNNNYSITYEVVYAIESYSRTRSTSSVFPAAGAR